MAAALTGSLVECAPGNVVTLQGSGLAGGTTVVLGGQLVVHTDGTPPSYDGTVTIDAFYTSTSVQFTLPDNVRSGTLTVRAGDSSPASIALRIVGQYVQASEFIGEGVPTQDLAVGELDQILRDASAWADTWTGGGTRDIPGFRLMQTVEQHKFHPKPNYPPRFWPWRPVHIASIDALVFLTSNVIRTNFNVSQTASSDVFLNKDIGYSEVLAYAFGNYVLLGMIETIGFSANVVELSYTSGYSYVDYPAALRKATKILATELLTYRKIQAGGMGGFASVKHGLQTYDRRSETFGIPDPAKDLLRPFISRRIG